LTGRARIFRLALGAVALLSAVGPAASKAPRPGPIEVHEAWARPAQTGASGGYLTLRNAGARPDRLIGAASPWVDRVELQTITTTGAVMRMRPVVGDLKIGPARTLTLAPGGYHLMLVGLKRPLTPGDRLPMTLRFETAGPVRTHLVVRAPAADGAP
jgi:copper(I)-binding protein